MRRWSLPIDHSTPSVCTVKPGKILQLSTVIGMARINSIAYEQHAELKQEQAKGKLKTGRLQPLGLYSNPQLDPNACLGIISIPSNRSNKRHHRSLTAPAIRPDTKQGSKQWRSTSGSIPPIRASSALPTSSQDEIPRMHTIGTHESKTKSAKETITKEETQGKKLPPIASAPKVMVTQSTSTDKSNGDSDTAINTESENSRDFQAPNQTDTCMHDKSRSANRKRRSSGGKLSHGWTLPQPLIPIVGGALLKNETSENQNLQHNTDISLHVDVSELLK